MKSCSRKILLSVLFVLISLATCFGLVACGFGSFGKLTNESGFVVEGGGFEEGAVLEASSIDGESEEYDQTLAAVSAYGYDKESPVYVFEIAVKKDGVKVQPNGKVKVTVPISEDLTGYYVLHVLDLGSIESLTLTYKNGKATFETSSFSKFVFVKKVTSIDGGNDGGNNGGNDNGNEDGNNGGNTGDESGGDTTTKYTVHPLADTIIPDSSSGGSVRDVDGEYITYSEVKYAEDAECTLYSHCYPNYYFLGWYDATESEEGTDATEETLLSTETTYTFTVTKDIDVLALYAHKTHAVKFTLDAGYLSGGFSYKDGKPTLTLVSSSEDGEKPRHESVVVRALLGDGTNEYYGTYATYHQNFEMKIVDSDNNLIDELDYSKVGKYTITYYHKRNPNINATLEVEVLDSAHRLYVSTKRDKILLRF